MGNVLCIVDELQWMRKELTDFDLSVSSFSLQKSDRLWSGIK